MQGEYFADVRSDVPTKISTAGLVNQLRARSASPLRVSFCPKASEQSVRLIMLHIGRANYARTEDSLVSVHFVFSFCGFFLFLFPLFGSFSRFFFLLFKTLKHGMLLPRLSHP